MFQADLAPDKVELSSEVDEEEVKEDTSSYRMPTEVTSEESPYQSPVKQDQTQEVEVRQVKGGKGRWAFAAGLVVMLATGVTTAIRFEMVDKLPTMPHECSLCQMWAPIEDSHTQLLFEEDKLEASLPEDEDVEMESFDLKSVIEEDFDELCPPVLEEVDNKHSNFEPIGDWLIAIAATCKVIEIEAFLKQELEEQVVAHVETEVEPEETEEEIETTEPERYTASQMVAYAATYVPYLFVFVL